MVEYYECHFGLRGVKLSSYRQLPSPLKSGNIEITVCASTWNRPKNVIVQSIQSIFNQSFPPQCYEVILVDDATEGERAKDVREAVEYLVREYPGNNFRAYFTSHTRCWTDPHTLNVAFKRALGWILMISQVDIIHEGETLEAAWRHNNQMENLWLCPKHYMGNSKPWPFQFFPHEFGASTRKKWVDEIKGRNERIIKEPADVEFHWNLNKRGVVFGEDPDVKTIHVTKHPPRREGYPHPPPPNIGVDTRNSDGTWTTGDWGTLTAEEESKTVMSEAMKKCIQRS